MSAIEKKTKKIEENMKSIIEMWIMDHEACSHRYKNEMKIKKRQQKQTQKIVAKKKKNK